MVCIAARLTRDAECADQGGHNDQQVQKQTRETVLSKDAEINTVRSANIHRVGGIARE